MGLLSSKMRDVLIDHLDGRAVPILRVSDLSGLAARLSADRHLTTKALLLRGFLKNNKVQGAPTHTLITEKGRAELCALLGEYADAIMRARFEMPPSGDGAPILSASHRHLTTGNRTNAGSGVDIPAAEAHLSVDYFTPAAEGATDGDSPTEAG